MCSHETQRHALADQSVALGVCIIIDDVCVCVFLSVGGGTDEGADAAGHSGAAGAQLRGEPKRPAGERRSDRETGQEGEGAGGRSAKVCVRVRRLCAR